MHYVFTFLRLFVLIFMYLSLSSAVSGSEKLIFLVAIGEFSIILFFYVLSF